MWTAGQRRPGPGCRTREGAEPGGRDGEGGGRAQGGGAGGGAQGEGRGRSPGEAVEPRAEGRGGGRARGEGGGARGGRSLGEGLGRARTQGCREMRGSQSQRCPHLPPTLWPRLLLGSKDGRRGGSGDLDPLLSDTRPGTAGVI